jgi:hypothetical protein
VADLSIPVSVNGKSVGKFVLPRSDGWIEVPLRLETANDSTLEIELGASGERVLYHLWAVAPP